MERYLQTLIDLYPVSTDQQAVHRLLLFVQQHLKQAGMHTQMLTYNGIHNLYASPHQKKRVQILLQAHIDVVPGKQPFTATEDCYEGRGSYDMLFAAAAYMRLVDECAGKLQDIDFGIMLSGDEELGGEHGVKAFLADGYTADICLLPDAGDGYGSLSVGAKGVLELVVRIHGKSHHGSRPWEGDGAASKLMRFLGEAELLFDASSRDNSTMTIATLAAGDALNRGPAIADAGLDIRYKDDDLARIQQGIATLLTKYNGEIINTLEGDSYRLDTSHPAVRQFLELYSRQVGKDITMCIAPGSSDARFFTKYHIPVIMLRPDGGGAHGDDEWVSRESTEMFYQLLKSFVTKFLDNGEKS